MQRHDGVHEFHDQHGLANPGPTKEPGFSATHKGAQEIDHLDAGFKDSTCGRGFVKGGRMGVDGTAFIAGKWRTSVQRCAKGVEKTPQALF